MTKLAVDRALIDPNALDVTSRLHEAGYQALLVGGCVRDILLQASPKDFDVATSATPEQVREVFRRARLVGRRFRIAHVRYGRDIIEVSTFRKAQTTEQNDTDDDRSHSSAGIILRDNVFGTLEEDAFRRDFTINALYFDPSTDEILDFVGGIDDLHSRKLNFIGEPQRRLTEDPVRLLRAVRFQAKLGLELDADIEAAIPNAVALLAEIPPARLFEEATKLLVSGCTSRAWQLIQQNGIDEVMFPTVPREDAMITAAMANTDARVAQGKPVTSGFLFAAMLWRDYQQHFEVQLQEHKPYEARQIAIKTAIRAQQQVTSIPKRIAHFVTDVWQLQPRLENRFPKQLAKILMHQRFRAAYDFLLLRAQFDEDLAPLATWWTEYQDAGETRQTEMQSQLAKPPSKRKRKRKAKKPATDS